MLLHEKQIVFNYLEVFQKTANMADFYHFIKNSKIFTIKCICLTGYKGGNQVKYLAPPP